MKHSILETTAVRMINDRKERSIFPPRLSEAIRQRYNFVEYPKTADQFGSGSALEYKYGYFSEFIVERAAIYNDALFVTSQVHSDQLDLLIDDIISVIESEFSIKLDLSNSVSLYNSKIEFEMNGGFSDWFNHLGPIVKFMENAARRNGIDVKSYEVGGFSVNGEGDGELKPGRFLLERRANLPFSDNMFFSEAPLSTAEHFQLIAEISRNF